MFYNSPEMSAGGASEIALPAVSINKTMYQEGIIMIEFDYHVFKSKNRNDRILGVCVDLFAPGMQRVGEKYSKGGFCGNPYMQFNIRENTEGYIDGDFHIFDGDDYDYYKIYDDLTKEQVHEIINWMIDHEWAEIDFPDCKNIVTVDI